MDNVLIILERHNNNVMSSCFFSATLNVRDQTLIRADVDVPSGRLHDTFVFEA